MLLGSSFRTDPGRSYSRDDLRALAARLTFCLNPIAGQSRATHRDQHRAHPLWTPRDRIRLGVDQEWLTHPIPSH